MGGRGCAESGCGLGLEDGSATSPEAAPVLFLVQTKKRLSPDLVCHLLGPHSQSGDIPTTVCPAGLRSHRLVRQGLCDKRVAILTIIIRICKRPCKRRGDRVTAACANRFANEAHSQQTRLAKLLMRMVIVCKETISGFVPSLEVVHVSDVSCLPRSAGRFSCPVHLLPVGHACLGAAGPFHCG